MTTKQCPFCCEQIQLSAVKCRYCHEWLEGRGASGQRYTESNNSAISGRRGAFSTGFIVFMLICIGPFALPLVWFNPYYKRSSKIIITVIVTILTVISVYALSKAIPAIINKTRDLEKVLNELGGGLNIQ